MNDITEGTTVKIVCGGNNYPGGTSSTDLEKHYKYFKKDTWITNKDHHKALDALWIVVAMDVKGGREKPICLIRSEDLRMDLVIGMNGLEYVSSSEFITCEDMEIY